MHSGEARPRISPRTKMPDAIYETSRKKLGVTAVVEGEKWWGPSAMGACAACSRSAAKMFSI
jgi:hypothetical protein